MDFEDTFPTRFYLNLGRRDDRRAEVQRELLMADISAERFPAIDYRWTKSSRGFESRQYYACALTHRLAIREAKKRKAQAVLIFEDDVVLAPGILDRLNATELPEDWGILYLGCAHVERPSCVSPGLVKVASALDCHAYAVKDKYFDLVLATTSSSPKGSDEKREAYDVLVANLSGQVPSYALFPNGAWQAVGESDNLGYSYSNYSPSGHQCYLQNLLSGLHAQTLGLTSSKYLCIEKEVPEPPPPAYRAPRVAFLFLTRDNLNHPTIWQEYLREFEGIFEIHVHPKYPEKVTQELIKNRILPEIVETAWADVSLVRATLQLLKAALKNSNNTHFILCSESCIPIRPFARLLKLLQLDGRSWVSHSAPHEYAESNPVKSHRFHSSPLIPESCAHLQEQWMILDRAAAEDLVEEDFTAAFEEMFAPDEAYFISLLKIKGFPQSWIRNQKSTWCEWDLSQKHPTSIEHLTPDILSQMFTSPSFFARKFPASTNLASFNLHLDET
jgi:hypothetical protein